MRCAARARSSREYPPVTTEYGLTGGGVDLLQQRWICRLGGVGAQAGQHRVDVVAVGQLAELGADGQVDGGVAALILKQLGARRDQPHRRGRRAPGRTEPDLALAFQPGVRIHGVVGRGRLGEPQVAQFAGHLGGLAALAAGVEDTDLGVYKLGRGDVGHVGAGHLLAELRRRGGRIGGGWRRIAHRGLMDVDRLAECEDPDQHGDHREGDEQQGSRQELTQTKGATAFVERGSVCDLRDHECTLRPASLGPPSGAELECDVNHSGTRVNTGTNRLGIAFDAGTKLCCKVYGGDMAMATDYDAPRRTETDDVSEDSLEELKARRNEAQSAVVDVDESESAESFELPGADLSGEELSVRVIPKQADEFTCSSCFLVHHRSRLASEKNGVMICTDCAA